MKLIPDNGCYKLQVNGQDIKFQKVSTGERGILGLCYFFANISEGCEVGHEYEYECLVCIDDSISSFDKENVVGVMSLLRKESAEILKKNPKSKILILTHDLQTVFNLHKIQAELLQHPKPIVQLKNYQLVEESIQNKKSRSEYKRLLNQIYDFINTGVESTDLSIGNIMRKVLEAYATFVYSNSFESAFRDEEVLNLLPENKRGFYKNFMYRLILNGESHSEERIYH